MNFCMYATSFYFTTEIIAYLFTNNVIVVSILAYGTLQSCILYFVFRHYYNKQNANILIQL